MALTNKTYAGASYLDIAKLVSSDFFGVSVPSEQNTYIASTFYNGKVQVSWSVYNNYITINWKVDGVVTAFSLTISGTSGAYYVVVPIILSDNIKYISGFVTRNNLIRVSNYVFDYMESINPYRASLANVYNGNIAVTALYSDTKFYEGVFSYSVPQGAVVGLYYIGGTLCYLNSGYAWALE